ncbi:MAG: tetratricopeptide repeat protein [Crocinitomicaceae bacterium]|nr:tetratricopeptide repeat protein [Crocinitomicaceae bacterium]
MFEEEDDMYDSSFNEELERFEKMIETHNRYYFDSEMIEQIIDHFIIKNQLKKALYAIDLGKEQHPSHLVFELRRAQVYTATGSLKESLLILQELEKTDPYNPDVFITKASVFGQLKDPSNAIRYYEKAIELVAKFDDLSEFEDVLFDLSIEYQNIHKYNDAIGVLKQILEFSPDNESAIYEIAYCFERLGDFDKCIEFYELYIDNNPFSFTAWYNLGNIYFLKNNIEKALWAYDYAVIINEDFSSAHFNMGNTYMQIGNYESAIESYRHCLRIDGDDAITNCYIGEAYERLEEYDTALLFYNKSRKLNEDLPDAWLGIGIISDVRKEYKEAVAYLERAVSLAPENSNYKLVLAEVLLKLEDFELAKEYLQEALKLDPEYNDAIELYAKVLFELEGLTEDAIEFLENIPNLDKIDTRIRVYLAVMYYQLGKHSEGLIRFQTEFLNDEKAAESLFKYFPEAKKLEEFIQIIESK